MERAERDVDGVTDTDDETSDGDPTAVKDAEDGCEQRDSTGGGAQAKDESEEEWDGLGRESGPERSEAPNRAEGEAAKEQHVNGDSVCRNVGAGRRCKPRSGVPVPEQTSPASPGAFPSSTFQKSNVTSGGGGGGRQKQTRRRNHHHPPPPLNRSRRRTGRQLVFAFKEMLSESLSVWCVSCVHMMIEIIVTLTHNCGVAVETGGRNLYRCGQQLLAKVTDGPGMKADAARVWRWTTSTGAGLLARLSRSVKRGTTLALIRFRLFCAVVTIVSWWMKGVLVRLGGERGKRFWTAVQDSGFWKRLEGMADWIRRKGRAQVSSPESPGPTGRCQPGQELERLLALSEVPEDELDPFTVLGVEVHATEAELKKAYRQLAVQVCGSHTTHGLSVLLV